MVETLRVAYAQKHRRRGKMPKLSIEDLLLATLEYLREYRTYAHIAASYRIAESAAEKRYGIRGDSGRRDRIVD